jgi:hypothetical protein
VSGSFSLLQGLKSSPRLSSRSYFRDCSWLIVKEKQSFCFHISMLQRGLTQQEPVESLLILLHFPRRTFQNWQDRAPPWEGVLSPGSPLEACTTGGLHSKRPTNLSSSLPSTGWILLVYNIFWHLPSLGRVCSQLLYRTSGEQFAHGAGTQWFVHSRRQKWHPIGRQRRHYQRMYLGILGKRKWVGTWHWESKS